MVTVALLLATAVWGWTFVLVKDALHEVGPLWFLSLRFALATLLGLPLLLRLPDARSGRNWRWGALLGLAMFGGYFFQTWGLVYPTAQKSGLITGLSVVLVPVIGWAFGRRRSDWSPSWPSPGPLGKARSRSGSRTRCGWRWG
jgi:drug/metabolite transporter (DMT)-like permease